MEVPLTAIEVTGTIDENHQLHLDETLSISGPKRVRVILLYPAAGDFDEMEWLRAAAHNPAFAYLKDEREDIYTIEDGKPIDAQA